MEANEDPAPRKRRRQQRSIDTRIKIVAAALAEFAKRGFEGASTRGIAQAADVPHSLVLHHFGNKTDLWHETVRETLGSYTDSVLRSVDPDLRPDERLRLYFASYVRFSAEHPDFFRMLTQENTLNSDRLHWLMREHSAANAERMTALIAEAQASGTFIKGDPLTILYVFLGAATGPYRSAAEIEQLSGRSPGEPDSVEAHIGIIERMFFTRSTRSEVEGEGVVRHWLASEGPPVSHPSRG